MVEAYPYSVSGKCLRLHSGTLEPTALDFPVTNALAYCGTASITSVKSFISSGAYCYKTFYSRKLRLFKISRSVCPWQAFPA
jgi:hypothetical protein